MQHTSTKKEFISLFLTLKESVCQNLWQGYKVLLPGQADLELSAPKEIINGMVGGKGDSEFVQRVSKTNRKGGDEKGVNYDNHMYWINTKSKQQINIMINAEFVMRTLFNESRGGG